jgi:hypothetical protein
MDQQPQSPQPSQQRQKVIRLVQDTPPPGGYPPLPTARQFLQANWYRGLVIFGIFIVFWHHGMYKWSKYHVKMRKWAEEDTLARINLIPFLQAETDRLYIQQLKKFKEEMKQLGMVETPRFLTGQWAPPYVPPFVSRHKM